MQVRRPLHADIPALRVCESCFRSRPPHRKEGRELAGLSDRFDQKEGRACGRSTRGLGACRSEVNTKAGRLPRRGCECVRPRPRSGIDREYDPAGLLRPCTAPDGHYPRTVFVDSGQRRRRIRCIFRGHTHCQWGIQMVDVDKNRSEYRNLSKRGIVHVAPDFHFSERRHTSSNMGQWFLGYWFLHIDTV